MGEGTTPSTGILKSGYSGTVLHRPAELHGCLLQRTGEALLSPAAARLDVVSSKRQAFPCGPWETVATASGSLFPLQNPGPRCFPRTCAVPRAVGALSHTADPNSDFKNAGLSRLSRIRLYVPAVFILPVPSLFCEQSRFSRPSYQDIRLGRYGGLSHQSRCLCFVAVPCQTQALVPIVRNAPLVHRQRLRKFVPRGPTHDLSTSPFGRLGRKWFRPQGSNLRPVGYPSRPLCH